MTNYTIDNNYELELQYLDCNCFSYCLEDFPSDVFIKKNTIFTTYCFSHFCYEDGLNIGDEKAFELFGKKAYFKIESEPGKDYITYKDVFIQSDKQMKDYLESLIKENGWNIEYHELLCSHTMLEGLGETTQIQYDLECGS